eukprot:1157310-Pelagomonas_calceolata.AAC.3
MRMWTNVQYVLTCPNCACRPATGIGNMYTSVQSVLIHPECAHKYLLQPEAQEWVKLSRHDKSRLLRMYNL